MEELGSQENQVKFRRLSNLQRTILTALNNKSDDYESLRDAVMARLQSCNQESFYSSFSRSLKNLKEKHLIKRTDHGFRLWRLSFYWEKIKLTNRGMRSIVK